MSMHSDDDKNIGLSKNRGFSTSDGDSLINSEQMALLESAKDKLRMATIERKRMSSINAESRGNMVSKNNRNFQRLRTNKNDFRTVNHYS